MESLYLIKEMLALLEHNEWIQKADYLNRNNVRWYQGCSCCQGTEERGLHDFGCKYVEITNHAKEFLKTEGK